MKMRRNLISLFIVLASVCAIAAESSDETKSNKENVHKMRERLEQLFIWRVADRLHLDSKEEAKFTSEYRRLSDERSAASAKMETILVKLGDEKNKKAKAKLLSDYEDVFKKYTDIQQDEMTAMKKLFDTDRLADYILLKRDLRHRFRDVLAKSGEDAATNKAKAKDDTSVDDEK